MSAFTPPPHPSRSPAWRPRPRSSHRCHPGRRTLRIPGGDRLRRRRTRFGTPSCKAATCRWRTTNGGRRPKSLASTSGRSSSSCGNRTKRPDRKDAGVRIRSRPLRRRPTGAGAATVCDTRRRRAALGCKLRSLVSLCRDSRRRRHNRRVPPGHSIRRARVWPPAPRSPPAWRERFELLSKIKHLAADGATDAIGTVPR